MCCNLKKIVGVLMLAVYAFFFASTNLFYHSHQFENFKIVHSHAGDKSQNHTASQLLLIEALSTDNYEGTSDIIVPEIFDVYSAIVTSANYEGFVPALLYDCNSLRAPPAWII